MMFESRKQRYNKYPDLYLLLLGYLQKVCAGVSNVMLKCNRTRHPLLFPTLQESV